MKPTIEELRERTVDCITKLADIEAHLIGYNEEVFKYARDLATAAADAAQRLEDELYELSLQEASAFEPLVTRSAFSLSAQYSAEQAGICTDPDELKEMEAEMRRGRDES